MPVPPQILLDMGWDEMPELDYVGPMAQAQKNMFKIGGIRAGIAVAAEVAQLHPMALDLIDGDKMMIQALEASGFPANATRSPAEVKEIRMIRQKQEAEARMLEQVEQASKASRNLAKGPDEGSPLKLLTEGPEA